MHLLLIHRFVQLPLNLTLCMILYGKFVYCALDKSFVRITLNGGWARRAGGPCFQMNNMSFWRAAQKARPAGCTTGRDSELHIKAGPRAAEKPAGPPFCAARWPGPLSYVQSSEIHVFHLETRPSSPPALQLVLSLFS